MGLLDRIPGVGSNIKMMKGGLSSMVTASVEKQYDKAVKNFLVLALGIENKDVLSKIFKNCKSFYKGNKKESAFSKEACDGIEGVFERVEAKEFVLEDAVWIRIVFVPYLKNRCLALKIGFMGRVLR